MIDASAARWAAVSRLKFRLNIATAKRLDGTGYGAVRLEPAARRLPDGAFRFGEYAGGNYELPEPITQISRVFTILSMLTRLHG
jgi:hypothetical protein